MAFTACMLPQIDYGGNSGTEIEATSDGSTIFAFKAGVPFRRSRDGGETWEDLSIVSGVPSRSLRTRRSSTLAKD